MIRLKKRVFIQRAPFLLALLSFPSQKATAQPRQIVPLPTWEFAPETNTPAAMASMTIAGSTAAPANTNPAAPNVTATAPLVAETILPASMQPPAANAWKSVRIPHIFRQSGVPDNGAGWYRQRFNLSNADRGRRIMLRLDGAATTKAVFVNGQFIGAHKGAYTASAFDLTPALRLSGQNQLDVRVSNRDAETTNMLARSTLFFVNGGFYRHAYLVKTGAVHIAPDLGSSGVYITPTGVSAASADVGVRTIVRNTLQNPANVVVRHIVSDAARRVVARFESQKTLGAGQTDTFSASGTVSQPKLWDLRAPQLYSVATEVRVNNRVTDSITERTGFRSIAFRDGRFILNGREVQFRGVNKHEQTEYQWNAVGDDAPRREWASMNALGVNMVRLAHYPHSKLEYNIADEMGLAVWAENGLAGQAWAGNNPQDKAPHAEGELQTREMVRQNWNHPSILMWSSGNESILAPASRYAAVIREEDTSRLVTYATEGGTPQGVDFVARNTYEGWYGNQYPGFAQMPRNAFVSETGSGEWITHHVPYGTIQWTVDKYEPAEYSELFTEYRLQTVFKDDVESRPMFLWWNFREFYDHKFKNNRNTKGIVTLAGMNKDIYYLFQAFMRPDLPVVHLNGRHHFLRQFAPDNGIKAYSNALSLQLTVNGVPQGERKNGDYEQPRAEVRGNNGNVTPVVGKRVANVFFWKPTLRAGRNVIEVTDGRGHRDAMVIYQKDPAQPLPADPTALVQDLKSSNSANQPVFIDRPVEAQGPVYSDVNGDSDNTFDQLPAAIQGASWIATRRLSDPRYKTDLSFRLNPQAPGATVYVLFSKGTYPTITLKKPDEAIIAAGANFSKSLSAAGFRNTNEAVIWRDHNVERTDAALWSRRMRAGETLNLPGETLDYVVLIKKN